MSSGDHHNVNDMTAWIVEELLLVKLSFGAHCFPGENDPRAVGYSPASCLALCDVSLARALNSFKNLQNRQVSPITTNTLQFSSVNFGMNILSPVSRFLATCLFAVGCPTGCQPTMAWRGG